MAGREPWIKLKVGTRRSGKLASLPSDSARLGYVWLLLEAKVQRRMGVFDNRAHVLAVMGSYARHLDAWIATGLVHELPRICTDCRPRYADVKAPQLVVHDFAKEQRDPTNADRQADYRANHTGAEEPPPDPPDDPPPDPPADPPSNADRNADRNGIHNGDRNALRNGKSRPAVTPTVTADSRARGTTVTVTETTDSQGRLPETGRAASIGPGDPDWMGEG